MSACPYGCDCRTPCATAAKVTVIREALAKLGNPDRVTYCDIADLRCSYSVSIGNHHSEPGDDGFAWYLKRGVDITCTCFMGPAMAACGYHAREGLQGYAWVRS